MKKKIVSVILACTMTAGLLAGCGGSSEEAAAPAADAAAETTEEAAPADTSEEAAAPAGDEGKVLNIRCWNEEFKSRVTDHYAKYEEVDATHGKIGDIDVVWNITPSDDNAYQNALDEALLAQESASQDEKIDMFLIEADYALKYVDTDYTMSVADLGITDAELANQYQYTKDIVTDSNGTLKGVSWQACPGVLFYNRDIAKEVLGSDDPAEVQNAVSDWDKFAETAGKLKDAGYQITSSTNDTFRTFSNNVSSPWVVDGKVVIDENIKKWVDMSKAMYDAGQTKDYDLWSDDWKKGFFPEGKVFCYFGPAWFINFSMSCDDEKSVGFNGGWGATEGPQGFYWGGTWICAATGTDNAGTIADIMRELTMNTEVMKGIVEKDDDFVNDQPAMEAMAQTDYSSKILGGQNPLPMYATSASTISLDNLSPYDQGCNEEFQLAMKGYFNGTYASYDDALAAFYKAITEKYPDLSY